MVGVWARRDGVEGGEKELDSEYIFKIIEDCSIN